MKVNGIDLKEKYGEKIVIGQQTVQPRNIITFTDWLDDADQPVLKSIPKQKFLTWLQNSSLSGNQNRRRNYHE